MFFISATFLILLLTFVSIILPESLRQISLEERENTPSLERDPKEPILRRLYSRLERFSIVMMSPITLFAPRPSPGGSSKKNYNLTFLGVGLFTYLISIVSPSLFLITVDAHSILQGVYQIKYLYAKHVYSWTAVEVRRRILDSRRSFLTRWTAWVLHVTSLDIEGNQPPSRHA